ncbi:unnamed protein product [Prorocentrum cordatum]|uniref:Uncharacterized protein n=1 Tax=Prorocentrum cordatum TaxID=2364126 RepID=A0ABN9PHE1_9DINO|nr:unnamed protein product [Polarella glacialis]
MVRGPFTYYAYRLYSDLQGALHESRMDLEQAAQAAHTLAGGSKAGDLLSCAADDLMPYDPNPNIHPMDSRSSTDTTARRRNRPIPLNVATAGFSLEVWSNRLPREVQGVAVSVPDCPSWNCVVVHFQRYAQIVRVDAGPPWWRLGRRPWRTPRAGKTGEGGGLAPARRSVHTSYSLCLPIGRRK